MKPKTKPKPKRTVPTKRKRPIRDISADGQLEVRGNEIIIHEPLKSEIEEFCRQRKITVQKYWDDLFAAVLKEAKAGLPRFKKR